MWQSTIASKNVAVIPWRTSDNRSHQQIWWSGLSRTLLSIHVSVLWGAESWGWPIYLSESLKPSSGFWSYACGSKYLREKSPFCSILMLVMGHIFPDVTDFFSAFQLWHSGIQAPMFNELKSMGNHRCVYYIRCTTPDINVCFGVGTKQIFQNCRKRGTKL